MNHTCSDSCFKNRTSKKSQVNCFGCLKAFNMNCFLITDNMILKTISAKSNVVFICGKCSDKIVKLRSDNNRLSSGNRLSVDSSVRKSAPSLESTPKTPEPLNSTVSNQNFLSQITNFFETITNKLSQIENKIDKSEESQVVSLSPNSTHETTTTTNYTASSYDNNTLDNIYKVVLKASDSINKLHTVENEKESIQKITNLIDKKLSSSTLLKKQTNLLDWSLHDSYINNVSDESNGHPSVLVKQSVDDDILKILKSSEETTWFTLDLILKKINENSAKLDSLLITDCSEGQTGQEVEELNVESSSHSPLIEAIYKTSNDSLLITHDNLNSSDSTVIRDDTSISDSQIEKSALNALHTLDTHTNSSIADEVYANSQSSTTGNPATMSKRSEEAMTHQNKSQNVPESSKNISQKREIPNSFSGWPGIWSDNNIVTITGSQPDTQNDRVSPPSTIHTNNSPIHTPIAHSDFVNLLLNDASDTELYTNTFQQASTRGSLFSSGIGNEFHLSKLKPNT